MNIHKRLTLVAFIIALLTSLMGFQPTFAADKAEKADSTSLAKKATDKTKKSFKCKKAPKSFVKNDVTVVNLKTCFDIKILKKMGCDTEAGKVETPAPPRDPRSECKGWLKVDFVLKMKSPKAPPDMMCTTFNMSITIHQRMRAHGLSISIANGRVNTWARTHLSMKDVIEGWIQASCVKIPPTVTPPPPVVTPPPVVVTPPPVVVPKPNLQTITTVNVVGLNETRTLDVSGTLASGHKGDLFCHALNGGTISSDTRRQTIDNSPFTKTISYTAPGEVPDVLKDNQGNIVVPAGHDMIECEVTQDDGQTDPIRTDVGPGKFSIQAPPPESE